MQAVVHAPVKVLMGLPLRKKTQGHSGHRWSRILFCIRSVSRSSPARRINNFGPELILRHRGVLSLFGPLSALDLFFFPLTNSCRLLQDRRGGLVTLRPDRLVSVQTRLRPAQFIEHRLELHQSPLTIANCSSNETPISISLQLLHPFRITMEGWGKRLRRRSVRVQYARK